MLQEKPLCSQLTIRSSELPSILQIHPSTLTSLLKKAEVDTPRKRGTAIEIPAFEVRKLLISRDYEYPSRAKVISLMMCKGGVGKTTTSLFLGQRLSAYGAKVLLIDADAQGNLTSSFPLEKYDYIIDKKTPVLFDIVKEKSTLQEAIIPYTENLHLLPSTPLNSNLDGEIRDRHKYDASAAIKTILEPVASQYEYILIDCAPALNVTNAAIIAASDLVILPMSPDHFSQMGLEQTLREIQQIEKSFKFSVETKLLLTKYDARELVAIAYFSEILKQHIEKTFSTCIRTCTDLKNAIIKREDLFSLKKSNGKEDYDKLTQELMGLPEFFSKRSGK